MKESIKQEEVNKIVAEVKTFPVRLASTEIEQTISISNNNSTKQSKEQIITQALKFHRKGNISEAIKYYTYLINQGIDDHRIYSNYGIILKDLGHFQEAEKSYLKAIKLHPNFEDAHSNLANLLRNLGKLKEAELSTRKAIQINPNFARAHLNLGSILIDLKELQEAELSTRKAIELDPNCAMAYSNLGNIFYTLGNLKEAELSTRKAIKLDPDCAIAYSNLGNILRDLDKLIEAERSIVKAIRINPNSAAFHYNLGSILTRLGKLKEAELSTRKAIEIDPNCALAHACLGGILTDLRKMKEAELSTRKAIEIDPESAKFRLNLGICQFALGDINSSLQTLELAYKLDPNDTLINTLRAIIKGKNSKNTSNLRIQNKINCLFEKQANWNPLVLHRAVEKDLIKKLYSMKAEEASNQDKYPRPIYGNIKGSDYDLFKNEIPILRYFQEDLIKILNDYFQTEIYITESFFNIIKPRDNIGGGNKIHNHLNKIDKIPELNLIKQKFSLVYYLSIGDQNCKDKGTLKFHKPTKEFLPEEGMIVIFPASRLHSVYYNGKKDRVVVVVNFYLL